MIKLVLNSHQRKIVDNTLVTGAAIFDFMKKWAEEHKTTSRDLIHAGTYRDIRDVFPGFPALLINSVRGDLSKQMKSADSGVEFKGLMMYDRSFEFDDVRPIVTLKLFEHVVCQYEGVLDLVGSRKFMLRHDGDDYVLEEK